MEISKELSDKIRELSPFIYLPNSGNYGDLLIHESVRQHFQKLGVEYKMYDKNNLPDKFNLVFCGAGILLPQWLRWIDVNIFTDKRIEKCLFLPFSSVGLNDLYAIFDNRFTLYCRDRATYLRMLEFSQGAECHVHPDMAISLNMDQVQGSCASIDTYDPRLLETEEEKLAYKKLKSGYAGRLRKCVIDSSIEATHNNKTERIAFLFRKDEEKSSLYDTRYTYDISQAWYTKGYDMPFHAHMLQAFSDAVKAVDVVVTDRLHVGIMSWLSGREVYLLDNNYKKLSGVYDVALTNQERVHLLESGKLTPELDVAWKSYLTEKRLNYIVVQLDATKKLAEQNHRQLLNRQKNIYLANHTTKLLYRYYFYRILSKLTWGKTKEKYMSKKRKNKQTLKSIRSFVQRLSQ